MNHIESDYQCKLAEVLTRAMHWIEYECNPNADFTGQGHNYYMNNEDRAKARQIITDAKQLLCPPKHDPELNETV